MTHANVDEIRDAHKKPTVNDIYEKIALSNNGKLLRACFTRNELLLVNEMLDEGFLAHATFTRFRDAVRIAG
jgi:hypothetical protein